MQLDASSAQKENTKRLVVLTGTPRSGTTLLGRILSTLSRIDYHFEPPMLWLVAAMLTAKQISPEHAALLLRVYFHEDLLCESMAGRKANLRPSDDSLVLNAIGWRELLTRWNLVRNRNDALRRVQEQQVQLAIKMPSIVDALPFIASAFPDGRFVIIMRDARDVVRSIIRKRWFTNENIEDNYWPFRNYRGRKVPHFIDDAIAEDWLEMHPTTRAAYLWRRDAELALEVKRTIAAHRVSVIKYEELTSRPQEVLKGLSDFLGTQATGMTEMALREVKSPEHDGLYCDDLVRQIDNSELLRVNAMLAVWGYSPI